jgi:hypothetical protein
MLTIGGPLWRQERSVGVHRQCLFRQRSARRFTPYWIPAYAGDDGGG